MEAAGGEIVSVPWGPIERVAVRAALKLLQWGKGG